MSEIYNSPEKERAPEQLAKKVSLLLIKPENSGKTVLFPHILNNYGLKTESHSVTLTEEIIQNLYPEINSWSKEIREATYTHLLNQTVEVLLVTRDKESATPQENLVQQVLALRGLQTNPSDNDPNTLRATFYGEKHSLPESTTTYWENGLHCPRDPKELVTNLAALGLTERALELSEGADLN